MRRSIKCKVSSDQKRPKAGDFWCCRRYGTVPESDAVSLGHTAAACTRDEVDTIFDAAKAAQPGWAKTPLWKRADYLHKVAALMKENAQPMADALVKEIAKPAKDALTGSALYLLI